MEFKDLIKDDKTLDEEAFNSYVDSEGLTPSESAELRAELIADDALLADEVAGMPKEKEVEVPYGFEAWYKSICKIPLLTPEQERELGSIIKYSEDPDKVKEARNELVNHNLRFVVSVASKYAHRVSASHGFEDMVQDGSIGLTRAAERFDVSKGFRFTTYAKDWIRTSIERGIQANGYRFRISSPIADKYVKLIHISNTLSQEFQRDATFAEMAEKYNEDKTEKERALTADAVSEIFTLMSDGESLDRVVDEESGSTIADFIENEDPALDPEAALMKTETGRVLQEIMRTELNENERRVINARFGLTTEAKQNLATLGKRLGVCGERIRQIEADAITKIANALERRGLDKNDLLR